MTHAEARSASRSPSSTPRGDGSCSSIIVADASSRRSPSPASCWSGARCSDLLADSDRVNAGDLAPYLVALGVLLDALGDEPGGRQRATASRSARRSTATRWTRSSTWPPRSSSRPTRARSSTTGCSGRRVAAGGQSSAVVFGLVTIVSTLVVTVGVVAVLITVAPVLVPIAVLGYVPIALVNVRNNRARYQLELELTELQRERSYLEYLMTDRIEAKEIRSYDIAPTLRRWHGELWDTRMTQLRALVRRRLTLTTIGSFVTTGVLVATLSIALILAGRGLDHHRRRRRRDRRPPAAQQPAAGRRRGVQRRARRRDVPARLRGLPGDAAGHPRPATDRRAADPADSC